MVEFTARAGTVPPRHEVLRGFGTDGEDGFGDLDLGTFIELMIVELYAD